MNFPQQELAAAVQWLKDDPRFRVFVHQIAIEKERAVEACLAADTAEKAEVLRLEARAYSKLLRKLRGAGVKEDETSGSDSGG